MRISKSCNITAVFLYTSTTLILHLVNEGIVGTFKAYYYLRLVRRHLLSKSGGESKSTEQELWKKYYVKLVTDNTASFSNKFTQKTWMVCIMPSCQSLCMILLILTWKVFHATLWSWQLKLVLEKWQTGRSRSL